MARAKRLQIRIGDSEGKALELAGERWPQDAGNKAELIRLIIFDWQLHQPLWPQLDRIERKLDRLLAGGKE